MHLERQSSKPSTGERSSRGMLAGGISSGVICLVLTAVAVGQVPTGSSYPGPSAYGYGPATNALYSPQSPHAAFQGQPLGNDALGADAGMGLPYSNGMAQPGQLQNVQFSQPLGDSGSMQIYGSPEQQSFGLGGQIQNAPTSWVNLRDVQFGVYANDEQTLINVGGTLELMANDRFGMAGRVQLGSAQSEHDDDRFHFTGDLYAGTSLDGEHWIKGGVLWDTQENFHKVGPTVGMLLFAEHNHPISLDFAYGLGYGDPVLNRNNRTLLTIADDDVQLRAGTYLFPNLQAGFSGNWLNWEDSRFDDYSGYGGYFTWTFGATAITADYTEGDGRSRGFINIAYLFGGRRSRTQTPGGPPVVKENVRDWLTKPVRRDTSLQLQRISNVNFPPLTPPVPINPNGVGNITQVNCAVRLRQGLVGLEPGVNLVKDLNSNGIIESGDTAEVLIQVVNGSTVAAQNVSFGTNPGVIPAEAGQAVGQSGTVIGTVPAGGNAITQGNVEDIDIQFANVAIVGTQVFVQFDVSSDGQTRRFQCGPINTGFVPNSTFQPATPVN